MSVEQVLDIAPYQKFQMLAFKVSREVWHQTPEEFQSH
jgi:hypothetical protein